MKLSTRSTYGIRALVELVLASGRGPVPVSLIAKQQHLSVAYLEQLLHRLKKHGMVTSIRGPKGGYCLARDADDMTIGEIIRVLDGELAAPNGTRRDGRAGGVRHAVHLPERDPNPHAQRIAAAVFHCVQERLAHALDEVTLQELCDQVRDGAEESLDHRYVFHI